jgi:hypothetical protein
MSLPEPASFLFRNLIEAMPEFAGREITNEDHMWLGRAAAAFESISEDGNCPDANLEEVLDRIARVGLAA